MTSQKPRCPLCGSDDTKKRFLGIPAVFGVGPGIVGTLVLGSGLAVVISGLANGSSSGHGGKDWSVKVIAGALVVATAIVGLILKNYRCLACEKRFNWPPVFVKKLKLSCPACGARLKGVTADMIGDIAACQKCKHEFAITRP